MVYFKIVARVHCVPSVHCAFSHCVSMDRKLIYIFSNRCVYMPCAFLQLLVMLTIQSATRPFHQFNLNKHVNHLASPSMYHSCMVYCIVYHSNEEKDIPFSWSPNMRKDTSYIILLMGSAIIASTIYVHYVFIIFARTPPITFSFVFRSFFFRKRPDGDQINRS